MCSRSIGSKCSLEFTNGSEPQIAARQLECRRFSWPLRVQSLLTTLLGFQRTPIRLLPGIGAIGYASVPQFHGNESYSVTLPPGGKAF